MASYDLLHAESDKNHDGNSDTVAERPSLTQLPTPPASHIPQSDSGICLTPHSQVSITSPQETQTIQEVPEDSNESSAISQLPPSSHAHHTRSSSATARHAVSSAGSLQAENIPDSGTRSSSSDHCSGTGQSSRPDKSSGRHSSDDFTNQTKYLVLNFLHQSVNENSLLHRSQNSVSTTSESEPRVRTYAERFCKQWQRNRTQSSPASPQPRTKPRSAPKMKGSKSSPNLKDANFFKDIPSKRKPKAKSAQSFKAARGSKRSPNMTRLSPVRAVVEAALIRSVSENTENSETGTYMSDADDELNTSFDSSQQGSTTSVSFRNRLAHYHHQAFKSDLPTVQSETESVADMSLNVAEEGIVDDRAASPVMDLGVSSTEQVDHQLVSPTDQYVRVTDYLVQMSETYRDRPAHMIMPHLVAESLEHGHEEEDINTDSPFRFTSYSDHQSGHLPLFSPAEDGAMSGGFEPNMTSGVSPEDVEGACGGVDVDDVDGAGDVNRRGQRADRSGLRLELHDHNSVVFFEAVDSLRQDIEEEMSSFESELEELEAMQSNHSEHSWSLHGLSHSQSVSPETAEIARRLARIGDEVQQKYFDQLDRAIGRLFLDNCAGLFTYENFREAAMMALDADLQGWKQVATVLLYSQQVALHLAQSGRRTLHRIVDYTVRLLADTAADFVIQQGGWASISSIDCSSTSSSLEFTTTPVYHTFHGPGSTQSTAQGHTLSGRSQSAPDLHTPSPHKSPNSTHVSPLSSHESPIPTHRANAAQPIGAGESPTSQSSLHLDGASSPCSVPGRKKKNGEKQAGQGGGEQEAETAEGEELSGGTASGEVHSSLQSRLWVGCAVSVAVIAVGTTVAFKFYLMRG